MRSLAPPSSSANPSSSAEPARSVSLLLSVPEPLERTQSASRISVRFHTSNLPKRAPKQNADEPRFTDENRLNQAREFGFERTVKVDLSWDKVQFAAKIREVMGEGCVPEVAFECTGAQSSIVGSIYVGSFLRLLVHMTVTDISNSSFLFMCVLRPLWMAEPCSKSDAESPPSSSPSWPCPSEKSSAFLPAPPPTPLSH